MDIIGSSTLTTLDSDVSVTADGNSAGLDTRSLSGQGAIVFSAFNIAGTNPLLDVKIQGSADLDKVTSVTPGTNTGNGTCTQVYAGPDSVAQTVTVTIKSGGTTFTVVGGTSGTHAEGSVGELYSNAVIEFMVTAGSVGFVENDSFAIVTTARTYADVAGLAFTQVDSTAVGVPEKIAFNFDQAPRYLRVNYNIAGTDSPEFAVTTFALSATQ